MFGGTRNRFYVAGFGALLSRLSSFVASFIASAAIVGISERTVSPSAKWKGEVTGGRVKEGGKFSSVEQQEVEKRVKKRV